MATRKRKKLGDIVLAWGSIDKNHLNDAMKQAERNHLRLGETLVDMGLQLVPDGDKTALPGQVISYSHILTNTGQYKEPFLPRETFELDPEAGCVRQRDLAVFRDKLIFVEIVETRLNVDLVFHERAYRRWLARDEMRESGRPLVVG